MFTHELKRLPKNAFEIAAKIPWATIEGSYERASEKLRGELEVEGFRRGKVPKDIAQKHLPKDKVYDQVVRDLLPEVYEDAIKTHSLRPIISPRVELKKAKENEEWQLLYRAAERPEIVLGDYIAALKKVKSDKSKPEIWVPGKDKDPAAPVSPEEASSRQQALLNDMLGALLKTAKVEIADVILEEEVNSRLSRLVDDVQKLGMTVETYLKSKNITETDLKEQYKKEIEDTHKLEFILGEIADAQKIEVSQVELDKLLDAVKTDKEREEARKNMYFYAMILRKQKVLDYLLSL